MNQLNSLNNTLTGTTLQNLFKTLPLPRLEQLSLAAHALNKPRSWLLAHDTDALTTDQASVITITLQRRIAGEPVAYIVGQREFYGLEFKVSPAVLIPRPETELLVDWLIKYTPVNSKVLDLGTGSGAIAITVAHHRPDCQIFASDISTDALQIATHNNTVLANGQVNFRLSNWCAAFPLADYTHSFDIIVSNPPYIAVNDSHLHAGDLRHEPIKALTDFADGLKYYHDIVMQAAPRLKSGGKLILEHGWQQSAALIETLKAVGYSNITQHYDAVAHDEQGNARMIVADYN